MNNVIDLLQKDISNAKLVVSMLEATLENPTVLLRPGEKETDESFVKALAQGRKNLEKTNGYIKELADAVSVLTTHVAMEKLNAETNTGSTATG